MRVVVTGSRTYFSLPVIRTLGRRGIEVTAADWDRHALGSYSRYARSRWVLPRVSDDPRRFVESLSDRLRADPHNVVLPLFEEALAIARHRDLLPSSTRIPIPDYATMMGVHDKRVLSRLAETVGVPIPETRTTVTPWDHGFSLPLVLKVPQSNSARGVAVVRTQTRIEPEWRRLSALHGLPPGIPAVVQRHIDGHQICALSFAWRGEPKGTLVYRNTCEFPASGGAGIARATIRHPEIEKHVEALLRATRWHGAVGFDFIVDRRTGVPFLIDGNPRFTPAVLLAQRSGLDIVGMAISEREPRAATVVKSGLRTRIDPLVALYCLRALLPQPGFRAHLRRAFEFLVPNRASQSDIFDSHDLRPLVGLGFAAADALRVLSRRGGSALDVVMGSTYADYSGARS